MRFPARILTAVTMLLVPAAAFALQETVWDFRGGNPVGEWRVSGLDSPSATAEGFHLMTSNSDGSLLTELRLDHPTDVLTLTFLNGGAIEGRLLWHRRRDPPGSFVELPFIIPAGAGEQIIPINVSGYMQWDPYADEIGLTLAPGANVMLREVRFSRWNLFERAASIWSSFWTFDKLGSTSINFVWGPVITFNPIGTAELFTTLPPRGRSGNWIFYAVLLLGVIALAAFRFRKRMPRSITRMGGPAVTLLVLFGGLWLVYDLRMGLEILHYAKRDYDTYLSQPPGSRVFRSFLNFNDMMQESVPALREVDRFALLTPPQMPILSMVRYFAYPSLPVLPQGPTDDISTWLIFQDDAVGFDASGRLTVNGQPWSKPGTVLKDFGDSTFLFQTTP